jgi:pseudouridine-5'-phosphate glycosidase
MESGVIIANPIPAHMAADGEVIEKAIQQSLQEVEEKGIIGRDITPYILKRVAELTEVRRVHGHAYFFRERVLLQTWPSLKTTQELPRKLL